MKCEFTEDGCLKVIAETGAEWMALNDSWDMKNILVMSPSQAAKEFNWEMNSILDPDG